MNRPLYVRLQMKVIRFGLRWSTRRIAKLRAELAASEEIQRKCKEILLRDGLDHWS